MRLGRASLPLEVPVCSSLQWSGEFVAFTVKILVFKAGSRLNTLAWNNGIGLGSYFVGFWDRSND